MNPVYNTPPNGDFASYVEKLSASAAANRAKHNDDFGMEMGLSQHLDQTDWKGDWDQERDGDWSGSSDDRPIARAAQSSEVVAPGYAGTASTLRRPGTMARPAAATPSADAAVPFGQTAAQRAAASVTSLPDFSGASLGRTLGWTLGVVWVLVMLVAAAAGASLFTLGAMLVFGLFLGGKLQKFGGSPEMSKVRARLETAAREAQRKRGKLS